VGNTGRPILRKRPELFWALEACHGTYVIILCG
jgi:hypothetical protein